MEKHSKELAGTLDYVNGLYEKYESLCQEFNVPKEAILKKVNG